MAHSQQILDELISISELVATLPSETPYNLPTSYFDHLPEVLMNRITGIEQESEFLSSHSKLETPYKVAGNYFDQLAVTIFSRIKLDTASCEQELEILFPLLLQLKNSNPFQLPQQYFEQFQANILDHIKREEAISIKEEPEILSSFPEQMKTNNPFTLPDGYFEGFAATVMDRIKMEEAVSMETEVEILSPLLTYLKDINPFTLPEGYFDGFSATVFERFRLEEVIDGTDELEVLSPLLGKIKKTVPFKLPEGYFEEFPSDITAGVNAVDYVNQELEAQAPIVNNLRIQSIYQVPEGYFDSLEDTLLKNVKHRKASIIPFNFNKKVLRYGIAALIAGIMSIGAWTFYNSHYRSNTANELAQISNDEIINYLDSTPIVPAENESTASVVLKEEDVKDLFADVSDEELQQYLEQQTASKDLIN